MTDTVKRPANPTPMFTQFFQIKDRHPDCLLLYRCGDFYELYGEDAEKGSKLLEIALTSRDAGGGDRIAMAGVPYHSLEGYLKTLIQKGQRVAICEQLEDPKKAKGLVKRDVVKVVTSGTITDSNLLSSDESNYLMALYSSDENFGLAYTDVSTGDFKAAVTPVSQLSSLTDEIFRIRPSEAVLHSSLRHNEYLKNYLDELSIPWVILDEPLHGEIYKEILKNSFKEFQPESLKNKEEAGAAAALLLTYLNQTQKTGKHSSSSVVYYDISDYMILDASTWRNLELSHTMMEHKKTGSLLWVIDNTRTAMGARLLRSWLERPLLNIKKINARLDAVQELLENFSLLNTTMEKLKLIFDLERITSRVIYGSANARDLLALGSSLSYIPSIKILLAGSQSSMLTMLVESIDPLEDVCSFINNAIIDDPPMTLREGHLIRPGYNQELDELRKIRSSAKDWIAGLEAKERERTGIKSLKVKFNNVFGYFIEITKSNLPLVPEDYIRKQTIANGERFISPQLKEYESKVLGAEEKIIELEYELFLEARNRVMAQAERIQQTSKVLAVIDCLCSLAYTARKENYKRPKMTPESILNIKNARHPVVEKVLQAGFVPNNTKLDKKKNRFHIITGPNMSGKSTYLRQTGLIVILAQMGSFVPAESAEIGITDRVFTRVGASDNLHLGKSTFLVEMNETANIINNATHRSLILLDEIGRGTGTYDGISIAWAVVEYIHNKIHSRSLFATHFHQLTEIADILEGVENYRVDVKESNKGIVFLHHIVKGGTDKSYGIYVAKLAGLPNEILYRARDILEKLESSHVSPVSHIKDKTETAYQLTFFDLLADPLCEELKLVNPDRLSPREALDLIYQWKRKLD